MVFFTCNACGSSLKKNQVEKHWQSECRNCEVLSCIDCGKDFFGEEYASHTKCISEAEKYQGSLYKESGGKSKGEKKQQDWLERVRESVSSASVSPKIARLLERVAEYPNIPRKKAKFENFVRNSCNVRDQRTLEEVWVAFAGANSKKPQAASSLVASKQPEDACESQPVESGSFEDTGEQVGGEREVEEEGEEGRERKRKKKKRKHTDDKDEVQDDCHEGCQDKGSDLETATPLKKKDKKTKDLKKNELDAPFQEPPTSSAKKAKLHKKRKKGKEDDISENGENGFEDSSPRKHKRRKHQAELEVMREEDDTKKVKVDADLTAALEESEPSVERRKDKGTKKHKQKHKH